MLKTVVEQMKLRAKFRFGKAAGLVPILADNNGHL